MKQKNTPWNSSKLMIQKKDSPIRLCKISPKIPGSGWTQKKTFSTELMQAGNPKEKFPWEITQVSEPAQKFPTELQLADKQDQELPAELKQTYKPDKEFFNELHQMEIPEKKFHRTPAKRCTKRKTFLQSFASGWSKAKFCQLIIRKKNSPMILCR